MRNQFISAFKVSSLAIVLSFGLSYALAWTAPSATPPTGNVSAPLNTSSTAQVKTGVLTVAGLVNSGVATTTKLSVTDTISGITTGLSVAPFYVPASTYSYCSSGSPRGSGCPRVRLAKNGLLEPPLYMVELN